MATVMKFHFFMYVMTKTPNDWGHSWGLEGGLRNRLWINAVQ